MQFPDIQLKRGAPGSLKMVISPPRAVFLPALISRSVWSNAITAALRAGCVQYEERLRDSAGSSALATADVLRSYRMRWQIELVFKRLTTLAQLGHLPKHDDRSSRA